MKKVAVFILFLLLASAVWGQNQYIWTGATSSSWEDPSNWEDENNYSVLDYPGESNLNDIVTIGSGGIVSVSSPKELGTLTIQAGASLDIGAHDLTVGTLANSGNLILEGSGTQSVNKTTVAGTVTYKSTGTHFAGLTAFHDLTVQNGVRNVASAITVSGDFNLAGGSLEATSITVTGTSNIDGNITTTGAQTYGAVTLGGDVTLTGTTVSLGTITGNSHSLTITGHGTFSGGSGIGALSVSGNFTLTGNSLGATSVSVTGTSNIDGNITTTGTQTYGAVTLGGSGTRILQGATVTLGAITGASHSLTITGDGVFSSGGSGIDTLLVSGTSNINGDITSTGNQTYSGAAILGGASKRTITSSGGNILFSSTLTSSNEIELSAANITISGHTNAKQLLAKAPSGTVSVNAIETTTNGNAGASAAIYIAANTFVVTTTTSGSIIPGDNSGAQWGQLCLEVPSKWVDTYNVIDGIEDTNPASLSLTGFRWHQHLPVIVPPGKILYSFTEDSNGNGKLDRIRVQTNKALNGDFSGFTVSIAGYAIDTTKGVNGFQMVNAVTLDTTFDNDSFYIYLIERTEFGFDTGSTPRWSVTGNTSLKDTTGALVGTTADGNIKPIDTIPPRITYTLTLPDHPQTYAHMSEPVVVTNDSAASFGSPVQSATSIQSVSGNFGCLFEYTTPYTLSDLNKIFSSASLLNGYFQISKIFDNAEEPDWEGLKSTNPGFPPKFPINSNYTKYAKVTDTTNAATASGSIAFTSVLTPPNAINPVIRRITDVLVSRTPSTPTDTNYFVWPTSAKPQNDNKSITDFDGSGHLEKGTVEEGGIELEALVNGGTVPQLLWTTADIPANMRNPNDAGNAKRIGGLWLPNVLSPQYYYAPVSSGINTALGSLSTPPRYLYDIAPSALANSGAKFEFVFHFSSSDMVVARLDASGIPSNWYERVRPFGFTIQGMIYQRGGVTVMNNVINSDKKDIANIRYELMRSGKVTIQIYTLDGTLVKSIRRNEQMETGAYIDTWDGSNNGGRAVARGMYFVRVVGPDIDEIRKIMVVK